MTKSLILEHLDNCQSSWSLGAFGALGEFSQDENETRLIAPGPQLSIATARGGIRVDHLEDCTPLAYETSRRHRDHWGQAVAFCLPEASARMTARTGITELGTDSGSILAAHREQVLFDLGLGTPYVDVCIRTDNADLIAALRALQGANILAPECGGFRHILRHHPHRVFISRLARLEVYQPIGIEKSPEGPHTHVLPKLLKSGLHHAANAPIPKGLIAGLMLYPANPCYDLLGKPHPFDRQLHEGFQNLLADYGLSNYVTEKQQVLAAYTQKTAARDYPAPTGRLGRLAARITLRQAAHMQPGCPLLQDWRHRFDRPETQETS